MLDMAVYQILRAYVARHIPQTFQDELNDLADFHGRLIINARGATERKAAMFVYRQARIALVIRLARIVSIER